MVLIEIMALEFLREEIVLSFQSIKVFLSFIIFVVAIIIITIVSNMFFFTDEREHVVVKQFNEVVKIVVDGNIEEVRTQWIIILN